MEEAEAQYKPFCAYTADAIFLVDEMEIQVRSRRHLPPFTKT
jgi:hypothetical protein